MQIGDIVVTNRAFLAPMSGISDVPFRALARDLGAGLVVSEMVASSEFVRGRRKALRKSARGGDVPFVMQLAGREIYWMGEGARLAQDLGADIIDINMGCPAREVTGKLSGSALMRDLDHATRLIAAVTRAVERPVTLKMRLGWDETSRNAPQLARRATAAGVQMITVHGRTRCQFFKGQADWAAVADVRAAVDVPVVVNGDIRGPVQARAALAASGCDAVMIGRAAYGAPWMPGRVGAVLAGRLDPGDPPVTSQMQLLSRLVMDMSDHYDGCAGLKLARKHIGWSLARWAPTPTWLKQWRQRLCTQTNLGLVLKGIEDAANEAHEQMAGAMHDGQTA